jgi:hypothetical protein
METASTYGQKLRTTDLRTTVADITICLIIRLRALKMDFAGMAHAKSMGQYMYLGHQLIIRLHSSRYCRPW